MVSGSVQDCGGGKFRSISHIKNTYAPMSDPLMRIKSLNTELKKNIRQDNVPQQLSPACRRATVNVARNRKTASAINSAGVLV